MNYLSTIRLHTGRKMPVMGLGTWQLTDHTPQTISEALELGWRMIDTSGDYGTQPGIAKGLERSLLGRNEIYIVTKVEEYENAYQSTIRNLDDLEIDYADLMLIHRPPKKGIGEKLWEGLIKAREEGFTKDIGVSNYSIEQIQKLTDWSGEMPVVNQIEWSPFGYSQEMLEFCNKQNIVIQAYSPLTRRKQLDDEGLTEVAKKYQKSPAQILIRWNLQLGTVPLPKANRLDHLEENLQVFDFEISDVDMDKLSTLNRHFSSLGNLQYV